MNMTEKNEKEISKISKIYKAIKTKIWHTLELDTIITLYSYRGMDKSIKDYFNTALEDALRTEKKKTIESRKYEDVLRGYSECLLDDIPEVVVCKCISQDYEKKSTMKKIKLSTFSKVIVCLKATVKLTRLFLELKLGKKQESSSYIQKTNLILTTPTKTKQEPATQEPVIDFNHVANILDYNKVVGSEHVPSFLKTKN